MRSGAGFAGGAEVSSVKELSASERRLSLQADACWATTAAGSSSFDCSERLAGSESDDVTGDGTWNLAGGEEEKWNWGSSTLVAP